MNQQILKSCKKGYTYDQDKTVSPFLTVKTALERIRQHPFPLIHDFYRFENYFDVPQYVLDCSQYLKNKYRLKRTNGKGATPEQAQASCIMEFVERFSSVTYNRWEKAKFAGLFNKNVLPLECMADSYNCSGRRRPEIISKIKDMNLEWGRAFNITTDEDIYVPKIFFSSGTTGRAAGNTIEEAVLQGLCECIERHVGAHVQFSGGMFPTVNERTVKNPVILQLLSKIESKNMKVIIKDFSSVLGVTVVGVLIIDGNNRNNIGHGIGVSPDRDKALIRALTEAVQSPLEYSKNMFQNRTGSYYFDTYESAEFLFSGNEISFDDVIDLRNEDFQVEIQNLTGILAKDNREVMFIDMTDSILKIPAVWVYVKSAYLHFRDYPLIFHLGMLHLAEKDNISAISCFETSKTENSVEKDFYLALNLGIALRNECRYSESLQELQSALTFASNTDEKSMSYFHLGGCYGNMMLYDEAIKNLTSALNLDSTRGEIYLNLGIIYQHIGNYNVAMEQLRKAKELETGCEENWEINFNLGLCFLNMNRLEEAELYIKKAVMLDCQKWTGHTALGRLYFMKKEYALAIESLSEAIRLNRVEWSNHNLLGSVYRSMGEYSEAEKSLIEAIRLRPDEWSNYNVLGNIYSLMRRNEEALKMYEKALSLNPEQEYKGRILKNIRNIYDNNN
ncbi:MAG: photosystem I assembly protein Ycf3 [Elusimicrobia bacterium ADurb.Bin231]|nr:MAG: photosystem I assembly protein Ycf3 [Elusimicrobia bacterium ADurb.Bin231]